MLKEKTSFKMNERENFILIEKWGVKYICQHNRNAHVSQRFQVNMYKDANEIGLFSVVSYFSVVIMLLL